MQYSFPSSLTIGLYGEWGSGKTSLLNMVFENVEQIDDGVVVLRFNPWLCFDSKQLVTQFFKQMATAIKLKNKKAEKVWELIDQYADVFDATSLIPVVGGGIAAFFRAIAKKAGKKVEKRTKDLQESKNQIIEKLKDEKMKIIVSIDDIDRLSEEEIVAVFQLVKSLADFPNTIYVLAFDYDVVVRALGKVQHGDGKEYLEKIVQVPFEIPAPNIDDIHEALFSKLNGILGDIPEEDWDKETWGELFQQGIKNYIKSIRDVIRYTNVFSLKYELLKNETSAADLLGLTCLQVFEPTVYSKLPSYKDIALYLNCVDALYGENAENHIFKDILDWNTFEDATEPELQNYDYHRSRNAFILAQRQIQILEGMLVKWPESEKAKAWLNAWACRLKQIPEKL